MIRLTRGCDFFIIPLHRSLVNETGCKTPGWWLMIILQGDRGFSTYNLQMFMELLHPLANESILGLSLNSVQHLIILGPGDPMHLETISLNLLGQMIHSVSFYLHTFGVNPPR
jgi:hypothetical protein